MVRRQSERGWIVRAVRNNSSTRRRTSLWHLHTPWKAVQWTRGSGCGRFPDEHGCSPLVDSGPATYQSITVPTHVKLSASIPLQPRFAKYPLRDMSASVAASCARCGKAFGVFVVRFRCRTCSIDVCRVRGPAPSSAASLCARRLAWAGTDLCPRSEHCIGTPTRNQCASTQAPYFPRQQDTMHKADLLGVSG